MQLLRRPSEKLIENVPAPEGHGPENGGLEVHFTMEGIEGHDGFSAAYSAESKLFTWLLSKRGRSIRPAPPEMLKDVHVAAEPCRMLSELDVAAQLKTAFKAADTNGNGLISFKTLQHIFAGLGDWSEDEFNMMITFFLGPDRDGDGELRYVEFVDWVLGC